MPVKYIVWKYYTNFVACFNTSTDSFVGWHTPLSGRLCLCACVPVGHFVVAVLWLVAIVVAVAAVIAPCPLFYLYWS